MNTGFSIPRVASSQLPARLVSTPSGLYFEWGLKARVKLAETTPVLIGDELARNLKLGLLNSLWRPPPSIRLPEQLSGTCLDFPVEAATLLDIRRAWVSALRRRFGDDVFSMTLRIFPGRASLVSLNRVAAHQQTIRDRLAENPALAPLLGQDHGMWNNLPNWQIVKNRMLAQGLTQLAWRWLSRQSRAYLAMVDWGQLSQLAWVNFHAALDRTIPVQLFDRQTAAIRGFGALGTWLRRNHEQLNQFAALNVLRGVRMSLAHALSVGNFAHRNELVQEEFPLIADWLLASAASSRNRASAISRQWTYSTLVARQAHWHLVEMNLDEGRPNVFWPEVLGMGTLDSGVEYIELNSLHALLSEAKKMHHCVPSYVERCMVGDVCIFHLMLKGHAPQRATLEFTRLGASRWAISQLKGPCNSSVSDPLWLAARQLLKRLGSA